MPLPPPTGPPSGPHSCVLIQFPILPAAWAASELLKSLIFPGVSLGRVDNQSSTIVTSAHTDEPDDTVPLNLIAATWVNPFLASAIPPAFDVFHIATPSAWV